MKRNEAMLDLAFVILGALVHARACAGVRGRSHDPRCDPRRRGRLVPAGAASSATTRQIRGSSRPSPPWSIGCDQT